MKKIILFTICVFAIASCFVVACKKKEFRGCNRSKKQFNCTINEVEFEADSVGCSYDTLQRVIYLYAKDTSIAGVLLFKINYSLQDMNIVLKPIDSLYTGKVFGTFKGINFTSKFGNLGMSFNSDNTTCGQFFLQDNNAKIDVSVGLFTAIPWVYWKP
jgi:hypothetical protein